MVQPLIGSHLWRWTDVSSNPDIIAKSRTSHWAKFDWELFIETIDILQIWQHFYSNFERCINCSFLKNIIFAQCEFVPSSFKDPTPSSVWFLRMNTNEHVMYEFNDAARRQSASSRGTAALCLPIIIPNGKDVLFVKWQTDFFFAVYQCHFSRETEKKRLN